MKKLLKILLIPLLKQKVFLKTKFHPLSHSNQRELLKKNRPLFGYDTFHRTMN
jgi:hypothetical protein